MSEIECVRKIIERKCANECAKNTVYLTEILSKKISQREQNPVSMNVGPCDEEYESVILISWIFFSITDRRASHKQTEC